MAAIEAAPAAGSSAAESFVVDGVTVQVEGRGPDVLLMLHGWPDTQRLWDAQVAAFAPHFRCVRFTLPCFEPGTPRDPASLDRIVELLHQVSLLTSRDRPVTLLLHDWGCLFGYQFAMQHPQRVARIVGDGGPCLRYPEDSFFYNPYGYWALLEIDDSTEANDDASEADANADSAPSNHDPDMN